MLKKLINTLAEMPQGELWKIALSSLIGVGVLVILIFDPEIVERWGYAGYAGIGLANLLNSAALFSPVPTYLLAFLGARQFDPLLLVIITSFCASLGELVPYLFGDGINQLVEKRKWHQKLKRWFYISPFWFLVIWIALPNPAQTLGQAFAGSVHYPWWKYLAANLLGNFIWFSGVVFVGYQVFA